MRLAGYQPQFFPRLHYLNRVLDSDIFEVSDYVQFVKKNAFPTSEGVMRRGVSFQAHSPVKLSQGEFLLVVSAHEKMQAINKTFIDYTHNWSEKMLKSLEVGYRKSQNFNKYYPELEEILSYKYKNLADLTLKSTLWGIARIISENPIDIEKLDIKNINKLLKEKHPFRLKKIFLASESSVPPPTKGKTNEWLIKLCRYAGADEYFYGGTSHSAYMDLKMLKKAGIKTVLQDWRCHEYPQQYITIGFIPNLSVIDLIMNTGLKERQGILI